MPKGRACQRRELQADPSSTPKRKWKQGSKHLCPSCQAQELLNFMSCIPLSKRIPYRRQSPKHFHKKCWPKKGQTATCTLVAWKSSPCVPSLISAKPQNPTRSQQCPARGGTCEPQIASARVSWKTDHTGLPSQAGTSFRLPWIEIRGLLH